MNKEKIINSIRKEADLLHNLRKIINVRLSEIMESLFELEDDSKLGTIPDYDYGIEDSKKAQQKFYKELSLLIEEIKKLQRVGEKIAKTEKMETTTKTVDQVDKI